MTEEKLRIDLRIPQGYNLKKVLESLQWFYDRAAEERMCACLRVIIDELKMYETVPSRGLSIQVRNGYVDQFKVPLEAIWKYRLEMYYSRD
jgi:hypothetical protein